MDVKISLTRLMEEFESLLAGGDFDGAEELLCQHLGRSVRSEPFVHFQFGRLYSRWNKLSSATNHLHRAAELAHDADDEVLCVQILEELKLVRGNQAKQTP